MSTEGLFIGTIMLSCLLAGFVLGIIYSESKTDKLKKLFKEHGKECCHEECVRHNE